jgi:hypothetical protein
MHSKGQGPSDASSFIIFYILLYIYYDVTLMRNIFRLKHQKPTSGQILVLSNICHVNYTNSLLVSVHTVEISTTQPSERKRIRNYCTFFEQTGAI